MRKYIRHPSAIPISYQVDHSSRDEHLKDIGHGGLCFNTDSPLKKGMSIRIKIPLQEPSFEASGTVAWCQNEGSGYAVGVKFDDNATRYSVRMVEQICHIEHYRSEIRQQEGRLLTSEEAAREWVEKYAADFP